MNTTTPLSQNTVLAPTLDIYEQNDSIFILAELPGVNNDNLNVQLHDKTLTIQGTIALATANGGKSGQEEVKSPYYTRTLQLGSDLDTSHIDADFKDGLLTLKLNKKVQAKPQSIDIKFC